MLETFPRLRWWRIDGPGELNLHLRKGSASSSPVVSVTLDQVDGYTRVTAWISRFQTRLGAMSYAPTVDLALKRLVRRLR